MESSNKILNIIGSIQRALLGKITPNLRAVYVLIGEDNALDLIFYYENNLSEIEEELSSLADTEFIADFPSPYYKTSCDIQVLPLSEKIPKKGRCIYKRYE